MEVHGQIKDLGGVKTDTCLKKKGFVAGTRVFKQRDPNSDANRSEYSKFKKLVKKSSKTDDLKWALGMMIRRKRPRKGQHREVSQKIFVINQVKRSGSNSFFFFFLVEGLDAGEHTRG